MLLSISDHQQWSSSLPRTSSLDYWIVCFQNWTRNCKKNPLHYIRSALNVEYETVEHEHPVTKQSTGEPLFLLFQQVGPLLYYFNGWRPRPSLLFQQVGPLLHYFNGVGLFFIISTSGAPSFSFQLVGPFYYFNGCVGPLLYYFKGCRPLLYYFKGCIRPCSFVLTFHWLQIVISNFRSNYSQIVHFQV